MELCADPVLVERGVQGVERVLGARWVVVDKVDLHAHIDARRAVGRVTVWIPRGPVVEREEGIV